MIWLEEDNQNLVVISYPLVLVIIVSCVALLGTLGILFGDQDLGGVDFAIFYGVIAVFLLIPRRYESVFDPVNKRASLHVKNLFVNNSDTLDFADIDKVEISYGRGHGVAHGGAVVLTSKAQRYLVATSDAKAQKNLLETYEQVQAILRA